MQCAGRVVVGLLVMAGSVRAQGLGPGSLGIYADASGTVPCANVPPNTATVLYVIATTGALTETGIHGAEFRIDVTNPNGWLFSYTPPVGVQVFGSPIDTDPDPNAGGGATIGFSVCQAPSSSGKVSLGTISVFNAGGNATSLLIRRHSSPTNQNYACPLFVACDSPSYTKYCLSPTPAAVCSTLTVPKAWSKTMDEDAVGALALSPDAIPTPSGLQFAEDIGLNGAELWVMGQQITTTTVRCEFDGSSLSIGGISVPLRAEVPVLSDETLLEAYGNVPYVNQKIGEGVSVAGAVALFEAETRALTNRLAEAFRHDVEAADLILRDSPLVESFTIDAEHGAYSVRFVGLVGERISMGDLRSPARPRRLKPLADVARSYLGPVVSATLPGQLIMVTSGGVFSWSGEAASQVRGQIEHIRAGRSMETLPPGPLQASLGAVQEIIASSRKVRNQRHLRSSSRGGSAEPRDRV
jgi:hypothetical protein